MANANINPIRDLVGSNLWRGARWLQHGNDADIDPASRGHTFIFPTHGAKFMMAAGGEYAQHMKNLMNIIRNASTAFSGQNNKVVQFAEVTDGFSNRKIQLPVSVTKDMDQLSITLHEFDGLVVKNALECWVDNTIDEDTQRARFGGLHETLRFQLKNYTMGLLVVQTDQTWTTIQDAAFYTNCFPTEVDFSYFTYQKGDLGIIENYTLNMACNERRGDAVMAAAQKYMNNFILKHLETEFTRRNHDPNVPMP